MGAEDQIFQALVLDKQLSFQYVLLACPVEDPVDIMTGLGLASSFKAQESILIPSLHLIGASDSRKNKSETVQSLFSDVQVKYMTVGHSIPRSVSSDKELLNFIQKSLSHRENVIEIEAPVMKRVSGLISMGLMSSLQLAQIELDYEGMKETIVEAFS